MNAPDTSPFTHCQDRVDATNRKLSSIDHRFLITLRRVSRKIFKTNDTFLHQHNPDTIDMRDLSHQQVVETERRKVPMYISLQNRIIINISGVRFETFKSTLEVYPNTLLGNAKRRKYYYDNVHDEYFFDRHRGCFEAILYYYQSKGRLRRPNSVPLDTFLEEITFFDLGQDALAKVHKDENLTEVEKTQLPRNRYRRYVWATMEYPEFSFLAKVFNILSLIIILISTITLAAESLPQYSHLSEDACQKEYKQHKIGMNNDSMNSNDVQSSERICLSYFSSLFHRIQSFIFLVNRDSKPSNIFVDLDNNICIEDFCLARVSEQETNTSTTGYDNFLLY
ncbi:unnamed protein product [Rotaria sordida]|uniref:BTB domain-containing protein n=1 Tax=Rotaria sordida TaxID=392033 RepID=A0A815LM15_9BILA|nr:unnamed protein product [Rotaria sordida]